MALLPGRVNSDSYIVSEDKQYALCLSTLEQAFRMAARIGLRQTCVEMPYQHFNLTQVEERLLGVSATGWRDLFDALGWPTGDLRIADLQQKCRFWANDEATKYAKKLNIPRPLLVTTIKPEGTASQIFGTGSGLHWDWAPYYIRRIRMSAGDALAKTLIEQGFSCYPELYDLVNWKESYQRIESLQQNVEKYNKQSRGSLWQRFLKALKILPSYKTTDEEVWADSDNWKRLAYFDELSKEDKKAVLASCNTVVFEFPVKSLAKQSQGSVSAVEQLENMRSFTVNYCDHMPSSTITVKPEEWGDVIQWVSDNWSTFTTASFLPYYGGGYPLLPNEEITKVEYDKMLETIPADYKRDLPSGKVRFKVDEGLLLRIEAELADPDDVDLSMGGCEKGCPVR